ncbi:spore germination protein [Evansella sp. LMS18]|uniref:spore germination protein n=1 Tax=Evansella sp. LMS18 TaxID=2924033 RepID=UPI0020D169BD|nr:spore germination protein [Evansella sp. LMS18]UTR10088.1 spore germination protein [Evansella sp. LMS18]
MLNKLFRKLNKDNIRPSEEFEMVLSDNLNETVEMLLKIIGDSNDIVQRDFKIASSESAALFYIEGMSDIDSIEEDVLKPLQELKPEGMNEPKDETLKKAIQDSISLSEIDIFETFDDAILPFLSGKSLLVVDGLAKIIILGTIAYENRGIEEPQSEVVIRGPRDGFVENIQTNIVLIRRRIRDPNLTIQLGKLGRRSKNDFAIIYIKGITDESLVEEVRYRISCIDRATIEESGTIEQLIEDNVLSPFPQILQTERPDKVAAFLNNGQVIILVDGTPFSLVAPITFEQLFKSPEDYYDRWQIGSLIRMLRYSAAFIALFLPSLYIAMISYHQGMIPTTLALSIAGAREGVPFPAFVEALLMELTLELLREAGVRLPRAVGQTIGIVGGLVIGDAAVRAGIVNPIMVIVVALTAIASFAIPAYNVSITLRMLRFFLMFLAASFGLFGIIIGYIAINIHLVGLKSFGRYYTSPFAPYRFIDLLDTVIRLPLTINKKRNDSEHTADAVKQK